MADIQLDVASANRFISSLSKSLQALCHGCMDFDAGIEIVGYINVNIDSGSKVDYVLNEKVLKSNTTNSMTFVSNSFLAQKEQPKSSKDGSCSPIPELNYPQPQQRSQGNSSYPATQLYRSSGIYSPHSQVVRGSQKRQWPSNDWRTSPRKYSRGAKSQYGSYQQQQQYSSPSQEESYSHYSSQVSGATPTTPSSQQSQSTSHQDYNTSAGSQSDVNIKKEVDDNTGESAAAGGDSTDPANNVDNVNIKADPDAATTDQKTSEQIPPKSETDISDSFLQQPNKTDGTSEDPSNTVSSQDNSGMNYDPAYSESYGETTDHGEIGDNSNTGADSQGQSGADVNYDESGEMYPESYSGEGTSGGGQFEVIEIDDDDEDVAAMFDETRSPSAVKGARSWSYSNSGAKTFLPPTDSRKCLYLTMEVEGGAKIPYCYMYRDNQEHKYCMECGRSYRSSSGVKTHFKIKHCGTFDYHCNICGKGFQQQSHLKCHMVLHSGEKRFECVLCGLKYAHKTSLTSHMKLSHNGATLENPDSKPFPFS